MFVYLCLWFVCLSSYIGERRKQVIGGELMEHGCIITGKEGWKEVELIKVVKVVFGIFSARVLWHFFSYEVE